MQGAESEGDWSGIPGTKKYLIFIIYISDEDYSLED